MKISWATKKSNTNNQIQIIYFRHMQKPGSNAGKLEGHSLFRMKKSTTIIKWMDLFIVAMSVWLEDLKIHIIWRKSMYSQSVSQSVNPMFTFNGGSPSSNNPE